MAVIRPRGNRFSRFGSPVRRPLGHGDSAGVVHADIKSDNVLVDRGRDGTDTSYSTNTLSLGAGESFDVIFTAPPHTGGTGPDTYLLYDRAYNRSNNLAPGSFGGRATEIRVHPVNTLSPQSIPNT
jgi:hypothetical protein